MIQIGPTWAARFADIAYAIGLLSRVSLPVDSEKAMARGAKAAWAFPIVGLLMGLGFIIVLHFLNLLGMPFHIALIISLALLAFVTGAMHEDAFADVLDGFWGGWDKERRLEIMKDSNIGVYGVLGLIFLVTLKFYTYGYILNESLQACIGLFSLSRAMMVPVMTFVPNARGSGLSHSVGVPSSSTAYLAVGIGMIIALITLQVLAILAMIVATYGMVCLAKAKIEGQTGDVLGAVQNTSEIAGLLTMACLI